MKDIEDELPFISLISSNENNKDNLIWYSNQILNNENLNNNNNEDYIYSTLYNSFSFYKFASQLTSNNIINEENETLLNKDKISISLKNTNNNLCFNFYKSSSPSNSIMLYYPINILISKCKDYLSKFTEHPILNNILFICNSILSLDISETPLSKILSILDVLINSIHEWETYASKSINSLGNELNLLMKLIRYFRYIEIQSWKNFLLSKEKELIVQEIKDNFDNLINQKNDFDIDELNLYLQSSNLGNFELRLTSIKILSGLTKNNLLKSF